MAKKINKQNFHEVAKKAKNFDLVKLEDEYIDDEKKDILEELKKFRYFNLYDKEDVLTLRQLGFLFYFVQSSTIQQACEFTGICRGTYYGWKESNPVFERIMEIEQFENDKKWREIAKAALLRNINDGKEKSIFFYLERKHPEEWSLLEKEEKENEVVGFNFIEATIEDVKQIEE